MLSSEDIFEINENCPSGQGIFKEPNYIPNDIKEPVIYICWESGGWRGGSCWGDTPRSYEGEPKPNFKVLDLVLKKIKPDLTFLQFRDVEELIKSNKDTEREYYGNSTDYTV